MTTITVSAPTSRDLGPCQKQMYGPATRGRGGVFTPKLHQSCPNNAIVIIRGRAYCGQHAPAHAAKSRAP